MAEKNKPARDNFIARIVKDPKQVPDTLLLSGYAGDSSEPNHTRLYSDAQLSTYVEIPDDAILHTQDHPADSAGLGATLVWIKKDAVLIHSKASPVKTKSTFLEGALVNDYARGAQWPDDGGIDNTVAFCPITFAGVPCGFTTIRIACTILQPPTQQNNCVTYYAFCPSVGNVCPPPPTHNNACPTHSNGPMICHTLICQVQYANAGVAAQPQAAAAQQAAMGAQPAPLPGITIGACLTHIPLCQPTANPVCHSLTFPCQITQTGQICPTHTPACYATINSPLCYTHQVYCHTHTIVGCPHPTLVGCPQLTLACPTLGGCPSIACTFPGGGNQGF